MVSSWLVLHLVEQQIDDHLFEFPLLSWKRQDIFINLLLYNGSLTGGHRACKSCGVDLLQSQARVILLKVPTLVSGDIYWWSTYFSTLLATWKNSFNVIRSPKINFTRSSSFLCHWTSHHSYGNVFKRKRGRIL